MAEQHSYCYWQPPKQLLLVLLSRSDFLSFPSQARLTCHQPLLLLAEHQGISKRQVILSLSQSLKLLMSDDDFGFLFDEAGNGYRLI